MGERRQEGDGGEKERREEGEKREREERSEKIRERRESERIQFVAELQAHLLWILTCTHKQIIIDMNAHNNTCTHARKNTHMHTHMQQ